MTAHVPIESAQCRKCMLYHYIPANVSFRTWQHVKMHNLHDWCMKTVSTRMRAIFNIVKCDKSEILSTVGCKTCMVMSVCQTHRYSDSEGLFCSGSSNTHDKLRPGQAHVIFPHLLFRYIELILFVLIKW